MPPYQPNQPQLAPPGQYQFQHRDGTFSTGLSWEQYRRLVSERIHQVRLAHRTLHPPRLPEYETTPKAIMTLQARYPRRANETPLTYRQRLEGYLRQGEQRRKALSRLR